MPRSGDGLNWWDLQPSLQRKLLEADPTLHEWVGEQGPDPRAPKPAPDRVGRVARVSRKAEVDPEVQRLLDATKLETARARLINEQARGIELQTRLMRARAGGRAKGHGGGNWPGFWTRFAMAFVVVYAVIILVG